MPRVLSRIAFQPFQNEFSQKLNAILQENSSQWEYKELDIKTQNSFMNIGLIFRTIENIWFFRMYTIDYDGTILQVQDAGLSNDRTFPFKDDFFVNFDVDPYFREFLETVTIETQKKRTACIVSNRIRKELSEAVWNPIRIQKWMDAGVSLEDM